MADSIRPTKKQRELLTFIEKFIAERGYSPSYREIKAGLGYNSVATVALHVNNLIKRGHLSKREHSARSLEPASGAGTKLSTNLVRPAEEKWLIEKVEHFFKTTESEPSVNQTKVDELSILIGALKILDLGGAAQAFLPRLANIKKRS